MQKEPQLLFLFICNVGSKVKDRFNFILKFKEEYEFLSHYESLFLGLSIFHKKTPSIWINPNLYLLL